MFPAPLAASQTKRWIFFQPHPCLDSHISTLTAIIPTRSAQMCSHRLSCFIGINLIVWSPVALCCCVCPPVFRAAGVERSREDLGISHADRRHNHHLRRGLPQPLQVQVYTWNVPQTHGYDNVVMLWTFCLSGITYRYCNKTEFASSFQLFSI